MGLLFRGSKISMDFDIIRYALIFLIHLGHNSGTVERSCSAVERSAPPVIISGHQDG
jgi:hypothetical protein